MLPDDKKILLSGFLGKLPEHVAARLAKAVEVDRLIGGRGLPHDEILRALRPQLQQLPQPTRLPTPQRYFCLPFEDLLTNVTPQVKQKGRIARATVEPMWQWLANDLMPDRHRILTGAIADAIVAGRQADIENHLPELWAEGAAALKAALNNPAAIAAARRKLGAQLSMDDVQEIAFLLENARAIVELQKKLPRPIPVLSDEAVTVLRDAFDAWSKDNPDLAVYVALMAMGRLERPWEALRLVAVLSRQSTDTLISSTDIGAVGEILFNDLDAYAKAVSSVRPGEFDVETLLANVAAFAELSSGIVKELGIRRDGKWGQRLAKDRGDVSRTMEGLLERAPKEISACLPVAKVGGFGKSQKPLDLYRAPDAEKVARAKRYAQLMALGRPFSVASAYSAKLNEVMDEAAASLRTAGEDLVREIRAPRPDTRGNAEAYLAAVIELSMHVLGEAETDLLRRRSRLQASA